MKERSFDEMIAYFNRRVSQMDITQDYKMELLGMVTALGYKHEKTAQQWIPCGDRLPEEEDYFSGQGRHFSEHVLVTCVNHANDNERFVDIQQTVDGIWVLSHEIDGDCSLPEWCEVVAWMPLPEPYKGEET